MPKTGRTVNAGRMILGLLFSVLMLLSFTSCVSKPKPVVPDFQDLIFEEGALFLQLKPQKDTELTRKMLSILNMRDESLETILGRTDDLYASCLFGEEGPEFTVIGLGRYPETMAGLSLRRNREWEKIKTPYQWWRQKNGKLEIAFVSNNVVCLSNGRMKVSLQRLYEGPVRPLPAEIKLLLNRSSLGLFAEAPDFPEQKMRLFNQLESFWLTFKADRSADSGKEAEINGFLVDAEYICSTSGAARSLFLLMRLNLLASLGKGDSSITIESLKSKDPVRLQDKSIILDDYPLSFDQIDWFYETVAPFFSDLIQEGV